MCRFCVAFALVFLLAALVIPIWWIRLPLMAFGSYYIWNGAFNKNHLTRQQTLDSSNSKTGD